MRVHRLHGLHWTALDWTAAMDGLEDGDGWGRRPSRGVRWEAGQRAPRVPRGVLATVLRAFVDRAHAVRALTGTLLHHEPTYWYCLVACRVVSCRFAAHARTHESTHTTRNSLCPSVGLRLCVPSDNPDLVPTTRYGFPAGSFIACVHHTAPCSACATGIMPSDSRLRSSDFCQLPPAVASARLRSAPRVSKRRSEHDNGAAESIRRLEGLP